MDKKNILTKIKELFNSEVERFEGTDYKMVELSDVMVEV